MDALAVAPRAEGVPATPSIERVTVPVGTAAPVECVTATLNVIGCPTVALVGVEVTVVVVVATSAFTITLIPFEVLALNVVSPA
jgi:hypothetical protein